MYIQKQLIFPPKNTTRINHITTIQQYEQLDKTRISTENFPIIGQDGAKRRQYLNNWTRRGQTQKKKIG